MLDLSQVLEEFKLRRDKIDKAILLLEGLHKSGEAAPEGNLEVPLPKRRGRKNMGPEERQEVALRMKKYWAKRRKRQVH